MYIYTYIYIHIYAIFIHIYKLEYTQHETESHWIHDNELTSNI